MRPKGRKGTVPKSREERPLTKSFNSQVAREQSSDMWNSDTDSDDELSWDDNVQYKIYRNPVKGRVGKRWTKPQYRLGIVMLVAVLVIAVLAGVVIWQYTAMKDKVCNTAACVQTSAYITAKMDLHADPCVDFYQFACGNWEKTTQIPASRKKYSLFTEISDKNEDIIRPLIEKDDDEYKGKKSEAIKKAKDYYKLCMAEDVIDTLGNKPLEEFIAELGSWTVSPIAGSPWKEASWSLLGAVTKNHKYTGGGLFNMEVTVDDKNSSAYKIQFMQDGLTLQTREGYFKNNTKYSNYKAGFMGFAKKVGKNLGGENSSITAAFESIYSFEQKLAEIHVPKEDLLDPEKNYHKMTVSEFQKIMGNFISVKSYLSKMFSIDIPDSMEVLVVTLDYFKKLGPIVDQTDKSTLANYLVWNVINKLVGYLPSQYIDAALILDKEETGVTKVDPRWRRCLMKVNAAFGFVTSTLYIQDNFPGSSRSEVSTIVEEVRKAFIENMPQVAWMDRETEKKAVDKADYIVKMIGYPDWITDVEKLDEYYKNVTISDGEFFKSHLSILLFNEERNLNRLGTVPDRAEWHMKPYVTNAYYTPSYNAIVFPAGILQRPFYSPAFPMSFNFGTTGMIVGHEMTHGFDNSGRHYDKYGNLNNWWTNKSAESFSKHSGCMVKQYSAYTAERIHLKGERVLGENIADNGGLKSAYTAYKHWVRNNQASLKENLPGLDYTQEQLFFIGFGQLWCAKYTKEYTKTAILTDEHTISKYRTIGVLSNSGDFARAFNCKPNSPMNPQTKCQVW